MHLKVVHSSAVCSSLLLYGFWDHKTIKEKFSEWLKKNKRITHMGDCYRLDQFAFVVAQTTTGWYYEKYNKELEELGFVKHGPEYASKTGSNLFFWVIDMETLLRKVKKT